MIFYVRLWTPSIRKCLSPSKTLLQVRLELTTSALLCCVLPYKYRALTDCATGAVDSKHFSKHYGLCVVTFNVFHEISSN